MRFSNQWKLYELICKFSNGVSKYNLAMILHWKVKKVVRYANKLVRNNVIYKKLTYYLPYTIQQLEDIYNGKD